MMNKKIGVFHLPKTGGSFLINYFNENVLPQYYNHYKHHTYYEVNVQAQKTFNIIFVRNPLAFYVSQYYYFAKQNIRIEAGISKDCDAGLYGNEFIQKFPTLESHIRYGFDNLLNFSISQLFVKMAYFNDKMVMDYVGKTETMNEDIGKIFSGLKIPIAKSIDEYFEIIKHDNIKLNKTYHDTFEKYYSSDLIKLVKKKDELIFEKYYC